MIRKSQIGQLTEPDKFWWATGIEDTFITSPHAKTGRVLDEYELTGHYWHWRDDLALIRDLGVAAARYGIPWHRIRPSPTRWDWQWSDAALDCLLEHDVVPIVDLVHYGLPLWLKDAFLSPGFPSEMAEYAARVAERFKGRIFAYTPLNEPRITAWYCGYIGWWPPFHRGWRGFVRVLLKVCRGMIETVKALESVDPEILPVHVDATDIYVAEDEELRREAEFRQWVGFLPLDLISGRVNSQHPLCGWLEKFGAAENDLAWFIGNAVDLPVIGLNMYPMFSRKVLVRSRGRLRIRLEYAGGDLVEAICRLYWERYGRPIFISETASVGSIRRRSEWLRESVAAVSTLRADGIPVIGYTWWPLFALVTWAYRQGTHAPSYYLKQMGLWDLVPDQEGELRRVQTPLVNQYRELTTRGYEAVGAIEVPTRLNYVS